jgi:hypothetical protein
MRFYHRALIVLEWEFVVMNIQHTVQIASRVYRCDLQPYDVTPIIEDTIWSACTS